MGLCICVTWAQVTLWPIKFEKFFVWRKKQPPHAKVSVRRDRTEVGHVLTSGTDWGRGQRREEPQVEKLAGKH